MEDTKEIILEDDYSNIAEYINALEERLASYVNTSEKAIYKKYTK